MGEKKNELERKVQALTLQRDNLSSALDEATDRIMLLERQLREQQIQVSKYNNKKYLQMIPFLSNLHISGQEDSKTLSSVPSSISFTIQESIRIFSAGFKTHRGLRMRLWRMIPGSHHRTKKEPYLISEPTP